MPARIDHPAVREQVRLLYIGNGRNLTLAAKTVGIPIDRAEKWKERGHWDEAKDAAALQLSTVSDSVGATADNLATALQTDSKETKLSLSRAVRKAARHIDDELDGRKVFQGADKVKHLVGSASQLHQWEAKERPDVDLHLNILAGQANLQFNTASAVNPESTGS